MVMGVERDTSGYMMREEVERDKLKGRAGLRAWKFEKRIEEGRGGRWARRWGGREEEEGEGYEFNRMGKREKERNFGKA